MNMVMQKTIGIGFRPPWLSLFSLPALFLTFCRCLKRSYSKVSLEIFAENSEGEESGSDDLNVEEELNSASTFENSDDFCNVDSVTIARPIREWPSSSI
jgi:hypothetical protein